jgi:hypothetical protein
VGTRSLIGLTDWTVKRVRLLALLLLAIFFPATFAIAVDVQTSQDAQVRFENRLNELLLWRLSDELALKTTEEQQLKSILKKYQEQRKNALTERDEVLSKMDSTLKANPALVCDICLSGYEKSVLSMAEANTKEFKELRKILGPNKMQKFLVIRNQMTKDVTDALRQPATPPAPVASPPPK